MAAIECRNLRKSYGRSVALDGLDLNVDTGIVYGLLGTNGAGKTTTVKVLSTLLRPSSGQALVDQVDVVKHPAAVRAKIGLTGQYAAVEERLTGRQNLELMGRYFRLRRSNQRSRAIELLTMFDLLEAADKLVKTYSGGMRRRLDIAMSIVSRPSILFLDEPTTGLDPRSRIAMWDFVARLGDQGTTVLLTTQYLEEADQLAKTIAVIDRGKKIAEGTPDQLKDQIGGDRVRVSILNADNLNLAIDAIAPLCTGKVESDPTSRLTLSAPIRIGGGVVPNIIRALDAVGADVRDMEVTRPTLDDVFLSLTGHAATAPGDADSSPKDVPLDA